MDEIDSSVLTRDEAEARAGQIGDLSYRLALDLRGGADSYRGDLVASFGSRSPGDTFCEFTGGDVDRLELNGHDIRSRRAADRILLPGELLRDQNELRVVYENRYDHTGEGFHQFIDPEDGEEYVYTGFEPYDAHRLFPCFDQPDLKATYDLEVTAPRRWQVVSAGRRVSTEPADDDRVRSRYETTLRISSYLFSVIAGPYRSVSDVHGDTPLGLYCRASLFSHLDSGEVFEITKQGLDFFSDYFNRPFPFTKYDQLFVPEFNAGGMENVGAVTYTDWLIFRDPPTVPMRLRRAEILLHELAHMWFGDLVTMRWWNDLWLNESFATFVAYLAMDRATAFEDVWLDFNTRVKAVAYQDDELPTTHPIADSITTTEETFLNFDEITYGKGASVLRQLARVIGDDAFRQGLHTYFQRHSFGNAALGDFLDALQEGTGLDLADWSALWIETSSLNTLAARWEATEGRVERLTLHQEAPPAHPTLRPHAVDVALLEDGPAGLEIRSMPAHLDGPSAEVPEAAGLPQPLLAYPNYGDYAYCKVELDERSVEFVRSDLNRIEDPLFRQQLWWSLWDMVRDRRLSSFEFLRVVQDHLPGETNLQIIRIVTARALAALRAYVPEGDIDAEKHAFSALCRSSLDTAPPGDARVLWLRALIPAASSEEDLRMTGRVVDGEEEIEGIRIDQEMRWDLASRWMAYGLEGGLARLEAEAERDPSDRGRRARLRAEVSRPDAAVKAEAWQAIHERGYESLHLAAAAMAGFSWRAQRDLLAPYAAGFFDRVTAVFDEWAVEEAHAYYRRLFPRYRVDDETRGRAADLLDRTTNPRLHRFLLESIDRLDRALACRAFAAANG